MFDRIVNSGKYNEEAGRKAFFELTTGLAYLNDQGIAHRDLKPENFMLASNKPDAVVKVADYGLSKILQSGDSQAQTVCGTPSYVAPEILECLESDGSYDAIKADGWSLGCNLYILLGGYPPFWKYADNQRKLFDAIMANDWSFDQPVWDEISDDAKALIKKLMEPDVSKRLKPKDALKDKWVTNKAPEKDLNVAVENMKLHVLQSRFRKAGLAVMFKSRLGGPETVSA